jgi:hypothetical protein
MMIAKGCTGCSEGLQQCGGTSTYIITAHCGWIDVTNRANLIVTNRGPMGGDPTDPTYRG